jgi:hypothetical protein
LCLIPDVENVPLHKRIKTSTTENEPEVDPLLDTTEHIPNPEKHSKKVMIEIPDSEMPSYMRGKYCTYNIDYFLYNFSLVILNLENKFKIKQCNPLYKFCIAYCM